MRKGGGIYLVMHEAGGEYQNQPHLWHDVAGAFGINHVFKMGGGPHEAGVVDYGPEHTCLDPCRKVLVVTSFEADKYGIEPVALRDYEHPDQAQYIFGPDNISKAWLKDFEGEDVDYITIPTPGRTELFAPIAASLVLWDRWLKMQE